MHLLGEPLKMENHPILWCRDNNARDYVLSNISRLTLYDAMQKGSALQADNFTAGDIQAKPYAYVASEPIRPSVIPSWTTEGFCSHYAMMRIFLGAGENGFEVMPGGLAITAPDIKSLQSDNPEKQHSRDILVLSDFYFDHR